MDATKVRKQNIVNANGIQNWALLMLTYSMVIIIIDNYQRFGIVKHPIEIVDMAFDAVKSHWWIYVIVTLCIIQQAFQAYIIEKLLSMELISDKLGLTLHAVNAFFSAGVFIILARLYSLNKGIIRLVMQFVFFQIPKAWSYAYVNYELRQQNIKNEKDGRASNIYPDNITLKNAITYILLTPNTQYQPLSFTRTRPNWMNYIKKMICIIVLSYISLLIVLQFIKPELSVLKHEKWNVAIVIITLLRLTIFVHLFWLTAYLIAYKLFHPAYADLMGMSHLTFETDWWNSIHLMEFWRRWNLIIHTGMKNNIVKPLLLKGWSKNKVEIVAFTIAGILHEDFGCIFV
ncbi:hypothetical protein FQR65_LT14349 [Abscondita terminalis]|nr:hypothetical protein FQR65_LT14349 [Abscondita terminalis]